MSARILAFVQDFGWIRRAAWDDHRRSLLRLERLVESVLLARWRALPPAQHDPELGMLLPL